MKFLAALSVIGIAGCTHAPDPTPFATAERLQSESGVPVFRSVSSWTVTHVGPNGYSSTQFAAINKHLAAAIRSNYPDRKIECFLVPRSFGYDVVILSEHVLAEADEAKINSLAVSERRASEEARRSQ